MEDPCLVALNVLIMASYNVSLVKQNPAYNVGLIACFNKYLYFHCTRVNTKMVWLHYTRPSPNPSSVCSLVCLWTLWVAVLHRSPETKACGWGLYALVNFQVSLTKPLGLVCSMSTVNFQISHLHPLAFPSFLFNLYLWLFYSSFPLFIAIVVFVVFLCIAMLPKF